MPRVIALLFFGCLGLVLPASAAAQTSSTGGAQFSDPAPIVAPGAKATLLPDGSAAAPAEAPPQVQAAIFAANKLLDKPYKYGGGHAKVEDSGYDCSGTVSYALLAADLLDSPLDSGSSCVHNRPMRGRYRRAHGE
jgi:cell wall-associated NlpC family hydrolase